VKEKKYLLSVPLIMSIVSQQSTTAKYNIMLQLVHYQQVKSLSQEEEAQIVAICIVQEIRIFWKRRSP
jgi:hypothetical protein